MIRRLLATSLVALFLAGCATSQPIHNVNDTPVPRLVTASENEVGKAVITAVTKRGWVVTKDEPGLIEARLNVRNKHTALVSIPYTNKNFSIEYKDSTNLDHKGNTIHRNYNKWVILLDREIQQELLNIQ